MHAFNPGYLETFGLMCVKCEFYQIKNNIGLVEKICLLMEEAQKFEVFHSKEAERLPDDQDYWSEEPNGNWYEAIDDWLDRLYEQTTITEEMGEVDG